MLRRVLILFGITVTLLSGNLVAEEYYPAMTVVENIEYSSYLTRPGEPRLANHPVNLIDENLDTAWLVSGESSAEEYVVFQFLTPVNIDSVEFVNGSGSGNSLQDYNRVKSLKIEYNDKYKDINLDNNSKRKIIDLGAEAVGKIKFTIEDIYGDENNNLTGLREIAMRASLAVEEENTEQEICEFFEKSRFKDFKPKSDIDKEIIIEEYVNEGHTSVEIIEAIFEMEYSSLEAAGNDDRLYYFSRPLKDNSKLIPGALKVIYEKSDNGIFTSESSGEDVYVSVVRSFLDDNKAALALMKHSKQDYYSSYYNILALGDTRIIPNYLDKLIETGIWHEFSCPLMPSEILKRKKDKYTEELIKKYLNEEPMSEEVRKELEKAI